MIQKDQEKIFLLVQSELFANEIKQLKSEIKVVPENSGISRRISGISWVHFWKTEVCYGLAGD